jgi:hypothetical protein
MSFLQSIGFSFLISNVGFGVHDLVVLSLLTQDEMSSLWGSQLGEGTLCMAMYKHIHIHTK